MSYLGVPALFIRKSQLLFVNASARVLVNGQPTSTFLIQQRMGQGCLLALYFILVVGEFLDFTIKQEILLGQI